MVYRKWVLGMDGLMEEWTMEGQQTADGQRTGDGQPGDNSTCSSAVQ